MRLAAASPVPAGRQRCRPLRGDAPEPRVGRPQRQTAHCWRCCRVPGHIPARSDGVEGSPRVKPPPRCRSGFEACVARCWCWSRSSVVHPHFPVLNWSGKQFQFFFNSLNHLSTSSHHWFSPTIIGSWMDGLLGRR